MRGDDSGAQVNVSRAPDPGFHAIMGHNIDLCEAMFVCWDTLFNSGRVSHTIEGLVPGSLYMFEVQAMNQFGISAHCTGR